MRAIARKPHDRIPRYETFWEDMIRKWQSEGHPIGIAEALEDHR